LIHIGTGIYDIAHERHEDVNIAFQAIIHNYRL
jgi:hypothetical protein